MRIYILTWGILFITSLSVKGQKDYIVDTLSIYDIIQNSEIYKGEVVQIKGLLVIEYEGRALYFSENSFKNRNYDSSIWVDAFSKNTIVDVDGNRMKYKKYLKTLPKKSVKLSSSTKKEVDVLQETPHAKYCVIIRGTYNPNNKGHFGLFVNGALEDIVLVSFLKR